MESLFVSIFLFETLDRFYFMLAFLFQKKFVYFCFFFCFLDLDDSDNEIKLNQFCHNQTLEGIDFVSNSSSAKSTIIVLNHDASIGINSFQMDRLFYNLLLLFFLLMSIPICINGTIFFFCGDT